MLQSMGSQRVGHDQATELNGPQTENSSMARTLSDVILYPRILECVLY